MESQAVTKKSWMKWLGGIAVVIFVSLAVAAYLSREAKREEYINALEAYARLPEMPVELTYRDAMMGSGLVISLKNRSSRNLSVVATFTNPTLHQEKSFRIDLSAKGFTEFGHIEGWAFASGDNIKIVHNEYKPLTVILP